MTPCLESGSACRPVTQEWKDADEMAEEKQTNVTWPM